MNSTRKELLDKILQIQPNHFSSVALEVFRYQAVYNPLYAEFLEILKIQPSEVHSVQDIPCLPISFFKKYAIQTQKWSPQTTFTSSGTTGQVPSRHLVKTLDWYNLISKNGFEQFYDTVENYCVLALLPSYLERSGSSLIQMVNYFIQLSKYEESGFFLYNHAELLERLEGLQQKKIPTLLIGVSFALLDLAEKVTTENHSMSHDNLIIMETGGMKGRRKEITRQELHAILKKAFRVNAIHSEYGMTELLSQAYSKGNGIFSPTSTMQILIKEITDPFAHQKLGKTGTVNIIDLANIDSCSFIATEDLGRQLPNGQFEILGRLDASDIRGCNLMVME